MNVSMSVLDRPLKGVSDSLQSVQVNAAVACDLVANCNGFFSLRNALIMSASRMWKKLESCVQNSI